MPGAVNFSCVLGPWNQHVILPSGDTLSLNPKTQASPHTFLKPPYIAPHATKASTHIPLQRLRIAPTQQIALGLHNSPSCPPHLHEHGLGVARQHGPGQPPLAPHPCMALMTTNP